MDFMQWALRQAQSHPDLVNAIVTADGAWLDILLPDGRSFRFRPGAMIKEDAPEGERAGLLSRLLSIGIEQASTSSEDGSAAPADPYSSDMSTSKSLISSASSAPMPDNSDVPIVPIVRAADFFIQSHNGEDSMVYVPLTDFIGVGLAFDMPDTIQPIYYSQLEGETFYSGYDSSDTGIMLAESVNALRRLAGSQHLAVEIAVTKIAGAEVILFLQPENYELSWMCDVEMMMQIAQHIQQRRPDDIPLFIPAAPTKLYAVFSEDPHLADFFKLLLAQRRSAEAVYPLPHTIAADGWREWVPLPGSSLAQVLGALRDNFRENIYARQVEACERWDNDFGMMKAYESKRLKSGERVSCVEWDALDGYGSIPDTDFIVFTRAPSAHPWEEVKPVRITIRSRIAREIWNEGIKQDDAFWPPRWQVKGFPSDEILARLIESADREF